MSEARESVNPRMGVAGVEERMFESGDQPDAELFRVIQLEEA
jgi:hypothetical protein